MNVATRLFVALCVVCGVVVGAELFIERHAHFGVDATPGFHALCGFPAYMGLVLTATQLRKLLKRPSDYYEPEDPGQERDPDAATREHSTGGGHA